MQAQFCTGRANGGTPIVLRWRLEEFHDESSLPWGGTGSCPESYQRQLVDCSYLAYSSARRPRRWDPIDTGIGGSRVGPWCKCENLPLALAGVWKSRAPRLCRLRMNNPPWPVVNSSGQYDLEPWSAWIACTRVGPSCSCLRSSRTSTVKFRPYANEVLVEGRVMQRTQG